MDVTQTIGIAAATMTSLSYLPQLRKAIPRGSTADLSIRTLVALGGGLMLWVGCGIGRGDWVVFAANTVGFLLVAAVCACVLRDRRTSQAKPFAPGCKTGR